MGEMKVYVDFRVPESYAKEFLPPDLGRNITDTVRQIRVQTGSDIYRKIGDIDRLVRSRDKKHFFLGWIIQRTYTRKELEEAKLLRMKIVKTFEPAGFECGTVYDANNTCEICGTGIRQMSELILDLNAVPKNTDIARTISNEIIVSERISKILIGNKVTGYEVKPVHHTSPKYQKEPWFQLMVNSFVHVNSETITGNRPFDEDEKNEYRCSKGHTIGLDILSELYIDEASWDGSDFVETKELFGVNRGLLRTYPLLLVSHRLYKLMIETKCRGFDVERVNLIM
jgi:hypothetical protein